MKITGIDGLSDAQIQHEIQQGAKFVIYQYCVSVVVLTFKRPSDIHFIRAGESAVTKGLGFTALSALVGWWGIPWGPIYTVQSIWVNSHGGRDVTSQITSAAARRPSSAP
jgi:hypothetical protein